MGVDASAVARVVGIDTQYKDLRTGAALFLAQHIAIIGQGTSDRGGEYALEPYPITSATQAAERFGYASPIHYAALELFPVAGGGVGAIPVTVLPLAEDESAVAAAGSVTPDADATVTATYWVRAAGIRSAPITVLAGDNEAAIRAKIIAACDAVLEFPLDASDGGTVVTLTAKWAGASGNDITIEVLDEAGRTPTGLTFTVAQPSSGAADPDVAPALAMLGPTWITMVVNTLGPTNTTALGKIATTGEARWDKLVRRPFVAFTGNPEAVVGTATTATAARPTDRVNAQVVAPGSPNLPVQIAAAHVREIAKLANNNPPTDYGGRALRTLLPGTDAEQWDYAERSAAVGAGSSTVELRDGLLRISDAVTMYHPAGEVPPAFRHVVDIVKLQNIIYNFDVEFTKAEWNGAPLIPDGQPTTNPNARTPKAAKAAACAIIDGLGLAAIISDPATAKANTVASIDASNPKRLNLTTTVQLSGNTNIISVDLNFGFYFGAPALVG